MKILCSLMIILILRQVIAGIVRKPPAFSSPVYSNSYLPAAMQVIFHAVEQLKQLQEDEMSQDQSASKPSPSTSTLTSLSTTESMKHQQSQSTTPKGIFMTTSVAIVNVHDGTQTPELSSTSISTSKPSSQGSSKIYGGLTKAAQHATTTASVSVVLDGNHEELPEVNEETTETNYESTATPETNHESPELVQEIQELNQEFPEKSEEEKSSTTDTSQQQSTQITEALDGQKKKEPSVDSVIGEIYGIVKTTTSPFIEDSADKSKSTMGISIEKMENIEDEEEETRFTLLGEKVAQVPRPSLNSYLRRANVPPRPAIQQLANLYDALSKDARKQGFARFAGYSDDVLTALQSSVEGGIGPQLKRLLEKVVVQNELTRDDARKKASQALRDLDDPASALSKDLRCLLPLRYAA